MVILGNNKTKTMKNLILSLSIIAAATTLFSFTFLAEHELAGMWNFNIKNAPQGYNEGTIEILEKDGLLKGTMVTDNGTFPMENLKASNDTITYELTVSTHVLPAMLVQMKDSISGSIVTPQGNLLLSGKRKVQ